MQGLAGLDLGRQLLHRTCSTLRETAPTVTRFLTLSPIPGFLPWLRRCVSRVVASQAADRDDLSAKNQAMHGALNVPLQLPPPSQWFMQRMFETEEDRVSGASSLRFLHALKTDALTRSQYACSIVVPYMIYTHVGPQTAM
jgi:hypothetical protein